MLLHFWAAPAAAAPSHSSTRSEDNVDARDAAFVRSAIVP